MATNGYSPLTILKERLANTQIKLYTPDAENYKDVESCFVFSRVKTLGIVRPQSAEDVSTLVKLCTEHNIDFSVRTGGHDCAGRSRVEGALMIDMRDIKSVEIAEDKTTARVGGGVLLGDVETALSGQGLMTPCGSMSGVGYVGWSTLGGYGLFSSSRGLGVDQIVGAKLVNAEGQIIEADKELLGGIRGGGGSLGIIVELTIKVYPLEKMLQSTIIFDPKAMEEALTSFGTFYEKGLKANEFPLELQIQVMTIELPDIGTTMILSVSWASPDEEAGRAWVKKIAAVGPSIGEQTNMITVSEYLAANDKMMSWPLYGRLSTLSIRELTPTTASIISKYSTTAPGGGLAVSFHSFRSAGVSDLSVFGSRMDHHVLELIGLNPDEATEKERIEWALKLKAEINAQDPDNVLKESYISLGTNEDTDLKSVYGKNYERLMDLKRKYDGNNVFKNAIPKLL